MACLRKRTSIIHIRSWTYKAHTCTSKYISLFHHRYVLISVHLDISLCVALSCSLATYVCDIFGAEAIRKRAGAGQGAPHHDTQGDQDVVKPPSDNICVTVVRVNERVVPYSHSLPRHPRAHDFTSYPKVALQVLLLLLRLMLTMEKQYIVYCYIWGVHKVSVPSLSILV